MPITKPVTAVAIRVEPGALVLILRDGEVCLPWERCSARLAHASDEERRTAELSPGGYGIHWPSLDENLSVNGLLREKRSSDEGPHRGR